jgi:hypothetical protein
MDAAIFAIWHGCFAHKSGTPRPLRRRAIIGASQFRARSMKKKSKRHQSVIVRSVPLTRLSLTERKGTDAASAKNCLFVAQRTNAACVSINATRSPAAIAA